MAMSSSQESQRDADLSSSDPSAPEREQGSHGPETTSKEIRILGPLLVLVTVLVMSSLVYSGASAAFPFAFIGAVLTYILGAGYVLYHMLRKW